MSLLTPDSQLSRGKMKISHMNLRITSRLLRQMTKTCGTLAQPTSASEPGPSPPSAAQFGEGISEKWQIDPSMDVLTWRRGRTRKTKAGESRGLPWH